MPVKKRPKGNPGAKNKGGRPRTEFTETDWKEIIGMATVLCTAEEICSIKGVSISTLDRRIREKYGISFDDFKKAHGDKSKRSLRRKQLELAMSGHPTMLIWLGKQLLGQKDNLQLGEDAENPFAGGLVAAAKNARKKLANGHKD